MPTLKRITDMIVAKALSGDDHFFAEVGGLFQEVPLSILVKTMVNRIDFPKGYIDVSESYAAARSDNEELEPIDYLFEMEPGNYVIIDKNEESVVGTYQLSRFDGNGNISRFLIVTTDHTHIELYASSYSEDDPLLWVDGETGIVTICGKTLATLSDINSALNGIGIPIVKEPTESAESGTNAYVCYGDNFPVVERASITQDGRPVGKGKQIVFIPEHNNTGTDPTLQLNDGDIIPIRHRSAVDSQSSQNTVQIAENTLIQGMPYTLTFCGVAWLIDSYLPGDGTETTAKVTSVNGQTGNVKISAAGIGAALASINWKSLTKSYLAALAVDGNGYIDPKDFMLVHGQGCFFCRDENGQHFLVRTDLGNMETDPDTGVSARSGPAVVLYLHLQTVDGEETIDGGLWVEDTNIAGISSLEDLKSIALNINGSNLLTESALTDTLKAYVTNKGLLLELLNYPTIEEMNKAISSASKYYVVKISYANNVYTADHTFDEIIAALKTQQVELKYGDCSFRFNSASKSYASFTRDTDTGFEIFRVTSDNEWSHSQTDFSKDTLNQISKDVLSTSIRKYTEVISIEPGQYTSKRGLLRVDINGAEVLMQRWPSIKSCQIHLLLNARKRGSGFHWWHPKNYDYEVPGQPFEDNVGQRIGYGTIAGALTNRDEAERFPAIPSWMPHDGYMETEFDLTYSDLSRGYILLDPREYFIPMVKPVGTQAKSAWDKIAFMTVASSLDAAHIKPLLCTFVLCIDGEYVGQCQNVLRVGCTKDQENATRVELNSDGTAILRRLYTSIT